MKSELSYGIIPLSADKKRVLIMHQRNGAFWGFPKGHSEAGESEKHAAERELFEEVGLRVKEYVDFPPIEQHYQFERGREIIDKKVIFFVAITNSNLVISKNEVIEAKWIPIENAAKFMKYQAGKEAVEELERRLK